MSASAELTARNTEMLAMRLAGCTYREIGEKYALTAGRAQGIVSREYGRLHPDDPVWLAHGSVG